MTFTLEYFLLVFLLCCGVVQVAAAYGNLRSLFLLRERRLSLTVGIALMAGALLWFFWDGGRNIPDTNGGIAGASQFTLFCLGAFSALLVTFLVTSLTNYRQGLSVDTKEGISSLRETTFLQAIMNNLGVAWKLYRKLTRNYSSG